MKEVWVKNVPAKQELRVYSVVFIFELFASSEIHQFSKITNAYFREFQPLYRTAQAKCFEKLTLCTSHPFQKRQGEKRKNTNE